MGKPKKPAKRKKGIPSKKELQAKKARAAARLFKKRSEAAKKGWVTRRANDKVRIVERVGLKTRLKNAAIIEAAIPDAPSSEQEFAPAERETLKQENARLKRALAEKEAIFALLKEAESWPTMAPQELLRIDGTVAIRASRVRHMTLTVDGRELDGWDMHMALKHRQEVDGQKGLSELAHFFSMQLDVPLREVYTLLYSP